MAIVYAAQIDGIMCTLERTPPTYLLEEELPQDLPFTLKSPQNHITLLVQNLTDPLIFLGIKNVAGINVDQEEKLH